MRMTGKFRRRSFLWLKTLQKSFLNAPIIYFRSLDLCPCLEPKQSKNIHAFISLVKRLELLNTWSLNFVLNTLKKTLCIICLLTRSLKNVMDSKEIISAEQNHFKFFRIIGLLKWVLNVNMAKRLKHLISHKKKSANYSTKNISFKIFIINKFINLEACINYRANIYATALVHGWPKIQAPGMQEFEDDLRIRSFLWVMRKSKHQQGLVELICQAV